MDLELTPEELEHMRHALGLDRQTGEGVAYRNWYVTGERTNPLWEGLCARKLAARRDNGGSWGGYCYYVTEVGREAVRRAREEG